MKPKHFMKSNTIRASVALSLGGIWLILELLIGAFDVTRLPPEIAAWAGPILLLLGLIFGRLRTNTSQPIAGTKAGRKRESMLPNRRQSYDIIDGKWWLFLEEKPVRELTDSEAADVIWKTK